MSGKKKTLVSRLIYELRPYIDLKDLPALSKKLQCEYGDQCDREIDQSEIVKHINAIGIKFTISGF